MAGLYLDTIPGHDTWTQYLDTIPGHDTWTQYLDRIPGHDTWTRYLATKKPAIKPALL